MLDELDHFSLLDSARVVLVELAEALIEVLIIETGAVRHVGEGVAHELLSLVLVQVTVAVRVVLAPDLVDALGDNLVDFGCIVGHRVLFLIPSNNFIKI